MTSKKQRIRIFSHIDLDGTMPVVILKSLFNCEVDYSLHDYDSIDKEVRDYFFGKEHEKYSHTFLTDISVDENTASLIQRKIEEGHYVRLIDHHNNDRVNYLEENYPKWCIIDYTKCGTKGFYDFIKKAFEKDNEEYFKIPLLNKLVQLTDDWDLWNWTKTNDQEPVRLNSLLGELGKKKFINYMTERVKLSIQDPEIGIYDDEKELLMQICDQKKFRYFKNKLHEMQYFPGRYEEKDFNVGIVHADSYISELGHYLFVNSEMDIDVVQMINIGKGKVSIRTREGSVITAQYIAQLHNGNGHEHAAGYSLTNEEKEKIDEIICCI